jgi:hypothetical protein
VRVFWFVRSESSYFGSASGFMAPVGSLETFVIIYELKDVLETRNLNFRRQNILENQIVLNLLVEKEMLHILKLRCDCRFEAKHVSFVCRGPVMLL